MPTRLSRPRRIGRAIQMVRMRRCEFGDACVSGPSGQAGDGVRCIGTGTRPLDRHHPDCVRDPPGLRWRERERWIHGEYDIDYTHTHSGGGNPRMLLGDGGRQSLALVTSQC